jgi:N-methylhydantoinase A/oxoprolinase/acetone carboxylase beta subunit
MKSTLYERMLQEAWSELKAFKVAEEDLITKSADLHYEGQYHEVEVNFPQNGSLRRISSNWQIPSTGNIEELYTFTLSWVPVEIRNLRLIVRVKSKKPELVKIPGGTKDPAKALKRTRKCLFNGSFTETPVYDSEKLKSGNIIKGPAIIEVPTTTAVIPPITNARCDTTIT